MEYKTDGVLLVLYLLFLLRLTDSTVRNTNLYSIILGQNISSDALFTPKVPIFTTLSHCTMSIRISEKMSLH